MRIIPTVQNGVKEVYPTLPSQQLRYYADILEEAIAPVEEETDDRDNAKSLKIEEVKHEGKGGYSEYKG